MGMQVGLQEYDWGDGKPRIREEGDVETLSCIKPIASLYP